MANNPVFPHNLGAEFDIGAAVPSKITIQQATTALAGKVELADAAEAGAGTSATVALTPDSASDALNASGPGTPNALQQAVTAAVKSNQAALFDGPVGDPRPNVNPSFRVLGVDSTTGDDYKFEVAQFSDVNGAGVAGQEPGKQKLATVDTYAPLMRIDTVNLINGIGYAAAQNTTGSNVDAYGWYAAYNNTGSYVDAHGWYAAYNNTGSYVDAHGWYAAYNNTGSYVDAYGWLAAQNNTGSNVDAHGWYAAHNNTGSNVDAHGWYAAHNNTGSYVDAHGWYAAYNNTGSNVDAHGWYAAYNNTGSYVDAHGWLAAQNNTGSNVDAYGWYAAGANTGDNVCAYGHGAAWRNNANNVDAFGWYAGDGPHLVSESGITVTAATATTVTISPATAAPIGSVVHLSVGASTITNFLYTTRAFTVTSPTLLTVVVGAGGSGAGAPLLSTTGTASAVTLVQTASFTNNSYFGRQAIGTGPNQAVLGGPSQTPCGWAAFTVISDKRQKLIEEKYDVSKRGLAVLDGVTPVAFRMNPEARYTEPVTRKIKVKVEEGNPGNGNGKPKTRTEERIVTEVVTYENDGSRADKHLTFGFIAQNVADAAAAAGVPLDGSGVRDMGAEGGADMLVLDTTALLADAVLAIKQLSEQNKVLAERIAKLERR